MVQLKEEFHGSDLETIEKIYGIKKEAIVSFAANVNPLGISPLLREQLSQHLDVIRSYPDREYAQLRQSIARYSKTRPESILVGNGATELISLCLQTTRPKKALILSPTYSEYEREINLEGGACIHYPLREEMDFRLNLPKFLNVLEEKSTASFPIDALVICNPNNPTSTSLSNAELALILELCKRRGVFLLVDETYVEFARDCKATTAVPLTSIYPNLIIFRGTSKFFAVPGLRLGYAITGNRDLLAAMKNHQNPWAVHSLAVVAGELMFSDLDYQKKSKEFATRECRRVYEALRNHSRFHVFEPDANFLLLKIQEAGLHSGDLLEKALRRNMLIRDCADFPYLNDSFIRFCVRLPEEDDKLLECLVNSSNAH